MKQGWQDLDYLPIGEGARNTVKAAYEKVKEAELLLNKARKDYRLSQVSTETTVEVCTRKNGVYKCGVAITTEDGELVYNSEDFETFSEIHGFCNINEFNDKDLASEIRSLLLRELK